jgi:hypothetical protein
MCRALPRLRKLAFRRDTYQFRSILSDEGEPADMDSMDPIKYYSKKVPLNWVHLMSNTDLLPEDPNLNRHSQLQLAWEKDHRDRMIEIGEQYAKVLPMLNWIYVGQLPMSIERHTVFDADAKVQAVPLSEGLVIVATLY